MSTEHVPLEFTLDGRTYPLSAKLRVAFKVQAQHNHKPYIEIFEGLKNMTLQNQIRLLWASFEVANPLMCGKGDDLYTEQKFIDSVLDDENLNLGQMLKVVRALMEALMDTGVENPQQPPKE